jgi:arylsulfatase A-like enzyme
VLPGARRAAHRPVRASQRDGGERPAFARGQRVVRASLAGAGYRTAFVGKWHLDGGQRTPGFVPPGERRQGFEWWAGNQCSHQHFRNWYFRDTPEQIFLDTFETEGYSRVACDYLRQSREDKRPFYLTVQWGPPHDPYKAPEQYRRRYDAAKLTMRPNWREEGDAAPRARTSRTTTP